MQNSTTRKEHQMRTAEETDGVHGLVDILEMVQQSFHWQFIYVLAPLFSIL